MISFSIQFTCLAVFHPGCLAYGGSQGMQPRTFRFVRMGQPEHAAIDLKQYYDSNSLVCLGVFYPENNRQCVQACFNAWQMEAARACSHRGGNAVLYSASYLAVCTSHQHGKGSIERA
eukprot:1157908-Pelagomonas_calceolata.AAC.12